MAEPVVTRAIIIGAGIGGLTTAIALQRAGIAASVYEQSPDLGRLQVGGGIHIWNNAMRAFRQLELADRVAAIGEPVQSAEFLTWTGAPLGVWPVQDIEQQTGVPAVGVSRADLQQVLIGELDRDSIHLGARCTGYSQDDAGVTARFADGLEERADVLIGADGLNSAIRAQLMGPSRPRYSGYSVWQAISNYQGDKAPAGIFRVLWGRGSRFACYYVGGKRLYWFCVINAPEGGTEVDKSALLRHFRGWMEPTEAIIQATDQAAIARSDQSDRPPAATWGEGRVTLLGDAAHPMTFNVGQGACTAIEDAIVLTRELAAANAPAAALRAYEAQRKDRTATFQKRAWQLGSFGRWSNPVKVAVRNQIMRRLLGGAAFRDHLRDVTYEF